MMNSQLKSLLDTFYSTELNQEKLINNGEMSEEWAVLRYETFQYYLESNNFFRVRDPAKNHGNYLSILLRFLLGLYDHLILKYFYKSDYLFFGHTRRKPNSSEKLIDIYFDDINREFSGQFTYISDPINQIYNEKSKFKSSYIYYYSRFLSKIPFVQNKYINSEFLKELTLLLTELEILDILPSLKRRLTTHFICEFYFHKLLKKLKPKAIFLVVGQGKEYLVKAARKLNIPSVELQHGTPSKGKLNYDCTNAKKIEIADYFLTFGDYWSEQIKVLKYTTQIEAIGYPYLSEKVNNFQKQGSRDHILILSQATINKELSSYAHFLAEKNFKILYKLHPQESQNWQKLFPELEHDNIEVVPGSTNLDDCFKRSHSQVGVYSTAIYEGLAFQCQTFIIKVPGWEHMTNFIEKGFGTLIEPHQIPDINSQNKIDSEYYFSKEWKKRLKSFLENF